jgi:hypothetical protein
MISSGSTAVSSRPSHDVSGAGWAAKTSGVSSLPPFAAAACMSFQTWVSTVGTMTV